MTTEAAEAKNRKETYYARLVRQLALECNTVPESFSVPGVTLTVSAKPEGVRMYSRETPLFHMATTGNSAVVTADEKLHAFLREWIDGAAEPHRLLEFPTLQKLDGALRSFGYRVAGTFHMNLPDGTFPITALPEGFGLEWFRSEEEIAAAFYPNTSFPNALAMGEGNPLRPDVIALAATDGETVAALAGASADAEDLWQIGIDVLPAYRGTGLGAAVVSRLAKEIAGMGKLPFYGTAVANLHSQRLARRCGFYPAWIDVDASRIEPEG